MVQFNFRSKLTLPWSPHEEDMTAPGCTVGAATKQSPKTPQYSRSVEAEMSNVEMAVAQLLPVTPSPVISDTVLIQMSAVLTSSSSSSSSRFGPSDVLFLYNIG
jgi:hypothetical protein